jgi:hypothetical protein
MAPHMLGEWTVCGFKETLIMCHLAKKVKAGVIIKQAEISLGTDRSFILTGRLASGMAVLVQ